VKRENSLSDLFDARVAGEGTVRLCGVKGSGPAYLAAGLLAQGGEASGAPLLVVLPDASRAARFARDLRFFVAGCGLAEAPQRVLHFPAWEILPYDRLSPQRGTSFERLTVLGCLSAPPPTPRGPGRGVLAVVTDARALVQRVLAPEALRAAAFAVEAGETVERDDLLRRLATLGYSGGPLAETRGEFSARGGIVDVFPIDAEDPVRIEFDADRIERIRAYDPQTQRSYPGASANGRSVPFQRVQFLPAREVLLDGETVARSKEVLRDRLSELNFNLEQRVEVLSGLERAVYHPGAEFLLPLLAPGAVPLTAHLGPRARPLLVAPEEIQAAIEAFQEEIAQGRERAQEGRGLYVEPGALWLTAEEALGSLPPDRLEITELQVDAPEGSAVKGGARRKLRFAFEDNGDLRGRLEGSHTREHALSPLVEAMSEWRDEGRSIVLVAATVGSAERLARLLEGYRLPLPIWREGMPGAIATGGERAAHGAPAAAEGIAVGDLSAGFRLSQAALTVVTESEIFGPRRRTRAAATGRAAAREAFTTRLEDLKRDDYIVHRDHGIAQYRALVHLVIAEEEGDFLQLEFAGKDRLYLPVRSVNLVTRYVGADDTPPRLDRLGGAAWVKAKGKAAQAVRVMARELLEVHAARQVLQREPYPRGDGTYEEFEARFPYDATPDQETAVEETLADLQRETPMDRLVCGDVGYGKTEVAMRAAFRVVSEGRQVAVLVPTTILALQHHQTFSERFKDYPVVIEELSRFKSRKAQREILERLAEGKVDIVIGTHRLLGKDVKYRKLGLLVVDEEQRFGVRHKELIKQSRKLVDVLTLTATPIPRTLHMGLLGLRDLSVINTPPEDRLAIRTFVMHWDEATFAEAVQREMARGGQVFFVHNRVQTIGEAARIVKRLVPEAKVVVAHGQLEERKLERVMLSFQRGMADVLVTTSIIENGLDLPNVNTLLVDRADKFGLAQLYQMRGRVGRGAHRAYAYLFIPRAASLTADAKKRLAALQELVELGSAFRLAAHDLEIRGAGNLLGANQSGHIAAVGYDMFAELLDRAIREMRGMPLEEEVDVEIDLKIPAFIPEGYVGDTGQRLSAYRRLSLARSEEEVADVETDLIDRYGDLPEEVIRLAEAVRVRALARALGVRTIERKGRELLLAWSDPERVDPDRAVGLARASGGELRLLPDNRLRLYMPGKSPEIVLESAKNLLQSLG
jgi:transcription-repair coupling factor (superfamily II helicase)